jgi:pathogenesis-related protein 1
MKIKTGLLVAFAMLILLPAWAQKVPDNTGSKITKSEAQLALDYHNKVRADVGSPALQWSADLAKFAQEWADHLASLGCDMQHRPHSGQWQSKYGENIFWGSGSSYTALSASESWYDEIKDYTYGVLDNTNWYKTGHYTQMVWKNTTHVGIGAAKCSDGAIIIVANYDPPGNYMGEKPY